MSFERPCTAILLCLGLAVASPDLGRGQLVGYWQAEGSAEESVHGIPGTPTGDLTFGEGIVGQGFHCGDLGGYVAVGGHPELTVGGAELTVESWVRPVAGSGFRPIVTDRLDCGSGNWQVYGSPVFFSFWSGGSTFPTETMISSNVEVPDDAWSFLVVTYDGAQVAFYLNGQFMEAWPASGSINAEPESIQIGSDSCGSRWLGDLDQLAIYRGVLSAQTIGEHYQLGLSGVPYLIFVSGFESSDTCAWSASVGGGC